MSNWIMDKVPTRKCNLPVQGGNFEFGLEYLEAPEFLFRSEGFPFKPLSIMTEFWRMKLISRD